MATVDPTAPAEAPSRESEFTLRDEERNNLLEYLTLLVPIDGCIFDDDTEETMHRGRAAVRRLANGGAMTLSLPECADVASLLSHSVPRTDPLPIDGDAYMGFIALMDVFKASVREASVPSIILEREPADAPFTPSNADYETLVERVSAFEDSRLGKAIGTSDASLAAAVALIDVVRRSLEYLDSGNEHEVTALEIALQRMRTAQDALEKAHALGAGTYPLAAAEAQS